MRHRFGGVYARRLRLGQIEARHANEIDQRIQERLRVVPKIVVENGKDLALVEGLLPDL